MKSIQILIICGVLMLSTVAFAQTYPLVTKRDIQEPTDMGVTDESPLLGDTVRVAGIAANGPRDIWIGARWSFFLVDTAGGPWSSLQIVQHDTFRPATEVGLVQPGDSIIVTGVVEEFQSATQLAVLTNPVTPLDYRLPVSFPRNPFPQKVTLLDMSVLQDTSTGEQYEEVLVRFDSVRVVNPDVGGGEGLIESSDGVFQISLEDWKRSIYDCMNITNDCDWPPLGTRMHVIGYVRDKEPNTPGARYMIAPWSIGPPYMEILSKPPVIQTVRRSPSSPSSTDDVEVTASIEVQSTGVTATVRYRGSSGWQSVPMTETSPDFYTGTIPAQAEGTLVKYAVKAVDDDGLISVVPFDTTTRALFYYVLNRALTVQDVQFIPDTNWSANSSYNNLKVTLRGIVTSSPTQYLDYWIQNGVGPWSGIRVVDVGNNPEPGDEIEVTGIIRENFGFTRLDTTITNYTVLSSGNALPEPRFMDAVMITTDSDSAEPYEGVLMELRDVVVTDERPDDPPPIDSTRNFGEFEVSDGTGEIRVDDEAAGFDGQIPDPSNLLMMTYFIGDTIEVLRGYLFYSFGDHKLAPRDTLDVVRKPIVSVRDEDGVIPEEFSLSQNYPNPFNPVTELNYSLAANGNVRLVVYNLLGQKVASIVDEYQEAGKYKAKWNGRDDFGRLLSSGVYFYKINVDNGKFVDTKKMLLLK